MPAAATPATEVALPSAAAARYTFVVRRTLRRSPPTGPSTAVDIGWATAQGSRATNEDRVAVGDAWAALSDGIGGYRGGARAAQLTVDAVAAVLSPPGRPDDGPPAGRVGEAVAHANAVVRAARAGEDGLARMGATLTVGADAGDGRWLVTNLGDSPAWLVRAGRLALLTEAHNLTGELVRSGTLDPAEAGRHPGRRVLLRAVGLEERPAAAHRFVRVAPGDHLVFASDGLSEGVGAASVAAAVGGRSARVAARRLVEAALAGGARDNVTVVVVRVGSAPG